MNENIPIDKKKSNFHIYKQNETFLDENLSVITSKIGTLVKKKKSNKTNKIIWLFGHYSMFLFGMCSIVINIFKLKLFYQLKDYFYRLLFIGISAVFFISLSNNSILTDNFSFFKLISDENFQFLIFSLLWLFSNINIIKLIPNILNSFLQLGYHFKIKKIIKLEFLLNKLFCYSEILLIISLLIDSLFINFAFCYQLILYLLFYNLRFI